MRSRLFWKILLGFWITFLCISEGVWLVFALSNIPRHRINEERFVRELAETRLAAAAVELGRDGEAGLRALLAAWPEAARTRLTWERLPGDAAAAQDGAPEKASGETSGPGAQAAGPGQTADVGAGPDAGAGAGNAPPTAYSRLVTLADGSSCRVTYETAGLLPMPHRPGPFSLPPQLVILGALGGLLFSTLLAWHLSTPIWRLREGFGRLASGELDVRLRGLMGRRRDEIADLARDFDRMAERMQALVESREQLLHDVSHELRSPLARQHTAIGLARQNPQRTASLLDRIEQESSRMDDLVGELLTLSRVEAEGGGFEEYFDLQSLVRVVVNNTRFEAAGDGVDIGLAMAPEGAPDEMFTVRGDSELVRRALENVLRNATRHSPRGSCVAVGVFVDGAANRCTIRVEDSGPGVPPEFLRQMFEPFVRLRKSKGQGVGLGLAIAKRAIAVHGGSIEAANRPEGGLCVTIVLPLEPPE